MKNIFSTLLIGIFLGSCQSTQKTYELTPAFSEADFVSLDHKYFQIGYDTSYRLARYVEYTLTQEQMKNSNTATRKNSFKVDPLLKKQDAVASKEYTNSGYVRGHLANSKDFGYDQTAQNTTFVMSNIVPQTSNLNSGSWLQLENQVRKWACGEEEIKIITGPILKQGLPRFKSGLVIPQEFYKIVLDETPPKKILTFIYFQTDKGNILNQRLVGREEANRKIKPQLSKNIALDLDKYPTEPLENWSGYDCFSR